MVQDELLHGYCTIEIDKASSHITHNYFDDASSRGYYQGRMDAFDEIRDFLERKNEMCLDKIE